MTENEKKSLDSLKELLNERECEGTVILENPSYVDAIIGITEDNRLIYSYEKMIDWLVETDSMEPEEAMEFIDYNTVRALPYMGEMKPIISYELEF